MAKFRNAKLAQLIITAIIAVVLAAVGVWTDRRHAPAAASTQSTVTTHPITDKFKAAENPAQSSTTNSNPSSSSSSTSSTAQTNPNTTLQKPFGNFVSNYSPNLSGRPHPNSEVSVCNTTPGAKCDIQFTSNGVTKNLGAMTTDSSGAAYWSWTLQGIGLYKGSWTVTAVASLGSLTQTTTSSATLEVSE